VRPERNLEPKAARIRNSLDRYLDSFVRRSCQAKSRDKFLDRFRVKFQDNFPASSLDRQALEDCQEGFRRVSRRDSVLTPTANWCRSRRANSHKEILGA